MSRKISTWFLLLALVLPLVLVACGGSGSNTNSQTNNTTTSNDNTAPAATDVPAAPAATDVPAAPEATDEPMVEEPMGPCEPAKDGAFAGVDPRGQTIVWWHNHSGSRQERLLTLVERFNQENECDITLDAQNQGGYNDIRDKVNASIFAGEAPAALIVGYQNDQAFYQLNEGLADLNDFLNDPYWGLSVDEQADFYASFFDQSIHPVFDNQRLGFPPNRSMEVMYYNQTWLEELGFDGPPTTPDEFKEMSCAAAAANGDGTGGFILRDDASAVAAWTYAFGGDVLTADGTGYVYNGEATIAAMTFLKGMLDEGCAYFFTEGFPNPEFAARRAVFTMGSSSGIPFYDSDVNTIATEAGRDPDVWGTAAIPHTTPEPVQNIYGGDIMITATSPEQELAAWIFIKWFTSAEVMAEWSRMSGYFPTRAGSAALLGDYVEQSPQWGQALELLPYSYYEPQLISYTAVRDGAQAAFNEIMQGDGSNIKAILDELTELANELQEELMAEVN